MTEYGRGPGSEPWHPDDPLYGDAGWDGQQAQGQPSSYGGRPQQHYPEQQQYQQQYDNGNAAWNNGHQGHQDAYAQQQYQQEYGDPAQQYADQNQHQQQYAGHGQQQYDHTGHNGWDNGTHPHTQGAYVADPADPYAAQQQAMAYGGGQQDFYGTPDAYPPPEPPSRRGTESAAAPAPAPEPAPEPEEQPAAERTDWDPGPDQGEHAFFAGGGDDDDDEPEGRSRADRKGRGGKSGKGGKPGKSGKKRRSGCACLVVVMVFGGGFAGVSYFGYQFYQSRFAENPDYDGDGTSETVTITVGKGEFGSVIGQRLKAAGVVKSVDAFTVALAENPEKKDIQAGVYLLHKEMSAKSAVALMLDPKSQSNFTVREGLRSRDVYALIDKELGVDKGTTEKVADKKWKTLGLPDWANDNKDIKDPLEGFLYPSTYPVAEGMKPEAVLKEMVDLAKAKYEAMDLEGRAKGLKLENPLQVLTVASLVQAEGFSRKDFEKVARVVYNRLDKNNTETYGLLDFDSTVNYLRGESKLATGSVNSLRQINDPYNTYKIKGLPPGPIDNPGEVAIKAALKPAKGDWYYFVSISKEETLFAVTNEEHNRNRKKYEEAQNGR
ncbi:endolytic transglycosylase MltG [Streptomyces scabiei]|uniref:endolytic transglycosylase MltG n=1 Tax=Streptomyces scabiei TaxID=1930 RepID=UPI001B30AE46|nr:MULTISPECIES: endolytic transglycosylase MltG [Streptomyces]MBP5864863.1 endolytic transglycosylase MltG [Streptomyces sp. LBUM 1484]MBP5874460.1 endolytic transglycosylase MltG [Streptomyces sp. LBUM 1477]MBP5882208.1 endolytic transglycosylase MltG [Streptomyces sp. LBUM 1487]MBP5894914.1 endolytic transglycosylase MltG [Streptomyces sp. LBUM 1481]MBP5898270.1 endolytic transglycosylase MltG [Streptomyces sp. LBUM 1488]